MCMGWYERSRGCDDADRYDDEGGGGPGGDGDGDDTRVEAFAAGMPREGQRVGGCEVVGRWSVCRWEVQVFRTRYST